MNPRIGLGWGTFAITVTFVTAVAIVPRITAACSSEEAPLPEGFELTLVSIEVDEMLIDIEEDVNRRACLGVFGSGDSQYYGLVGEELCGF